MIGQGRREKFPYAPDFITFMKDERRDLQSLTTSGMIRFMWEHYPEWISDYLSDKSSEESGIHALEKLCQRIAKRYGCSTQKPQESKMMAESLELLKIKFAIDFWKENAIYEPAGIYNVDETAINFDMPPTRIWAVKGREGGAKITNYSKHAGRLTAVITIRADGLKLPILFIVRGKRGGPLERYELPEYPEGHFYIVQDKAWMDSVGWDFYVNSILKYSIDRPSLLILDNFESHISIEGRRVVDEEAFTKVVPLLPNTTAACQPLDVGVMGPLKAKIRSRYVANQVGRTSKERRIHAIQTTISAWNDIPSSNKYCNSFL